MIEFNTLLISAGFDPAEVMLLRHRPIEPAMRRKLPWIVTERPDLFLVYQQIQWKAAEKAMTRAKYLASFIGQEPGKATFAGMFEVRGFGPLTYEGYMALPGNRELMSYGMTGRSPNDPGSLIFDLEPHAAYETWIGRLVVSWPPPERMWWRWAGRNTAPVHALVEESLFAAEMPCWEELVLSWEDLKLIPRRWRDRLAEWRGVYFIYDATRRAGYVGSAYGRENILGRWTGYAATGHGGNKRLRESRAEDLRFSILQRTSPDTLAEDVIQLEGAWKRRLHTREFGLNLN